MKSVTFVDHVMIYSFMFRNCAKDRFAIVLKLVAQTEY